MQSGCDLCAVFPARYREIWAYYSEANFHDEFAGCYLRLSEMKAIETKGFMCSRCPVE